MTLCSGCFLTEPMNDGLNTCMVLYLLRSPALELRIGEKHYGSRTWRFGKTLSPSSRTLYDSISLETPVHSHSLEMLPPQNYMLRLYIYKTLASFFVKIMFPVVNC